MSHQFHPEAREEYRQAAIYYEERRQGLGDHFIEQIELAIQQIVESPQRWALIEDGVRRCLTHIFPYAILYSIESDYILILAVMHCSREPGYWRNRLV